MVVGAILVVVLRAFHFYHLPPQPPLLPPGIYLPRPVNLYQILVTGEGWRYASIFLPLSLLDTHRLSPNPGKRETRRRRLPHNAVAAGQRPGHARWSGTGQRLSHHALYRPQRAQSQRRKNRLFHTGRHRQRHALPNRTCPRGVAHRPARSRRLRRGLVRIGHGRPGVSGSPRDPLQSPSR
jgi:hypothetical protein